MPWLHVWGKRKSTTLGGRGLLRDRKAHERNTLLGVIGLMGLSETRLRYCA